MAGDWASTGCATKVSTDCNDFDFRQYPLTDGNRAAKKYSRRGIINAHELLDKEMGVDMISYSWFPDPDTGIVGVMW